MTERPVHLIVVWARCANGHGIPDDHPQFVAAFPTSLSEGLPELYAEWLKAACDQYRHELDAPVVAFYEGRASITRPEVFTGFDLHVIEDDAVNPDWEAIQAADSVPGPTEAQRP